MKILVAPNPFKESLNSIEVSRHIAKGLRKASRKYRVTELPLADGGIGTVEIITRAFGGDFVRKQVTGPLGKPVKVRYGLIPEQKVAVIELAEAAGLQLVPKAKRNPLVTSTTGVGELIADAVAKHFHKIILAVGDSATIDCGTGALSVLGVRFLDRENREIVPSCRGLHSLKHIDMTHFDYRYRRCRVTIATDVKNILTGRYGAAVYARQKGAHPEDMPIVYKALKCFKQVVMRDCKIDLDTILGSGAAGGIGGAFVALMGAHILSGFGLVNELVRLEEEIKSSDIVITGEGRIDVGSFYGKTLKRVVDMAYMYKKPVILIAGSISRDVSFKKEYHVHEQYSLSAISKSVKCAIKNAGQLLERTAYSIGKKLAG